jgi:hypothetical protein
VRNTPHSVLFLGDSLTGGWDPALWERSLAPRGVLNARESHRRLLWGHSLRAEEADTRFPLQRREL